MYTFTLLAHVVPFVDWTRTFFVVQKMYVSGQQKAQHVLEG